MTLEQQITDLNKKLDKIIDHFHIGQSMKTVEAIEREALQAFEKMERREH